MSIFVTGTDTDVGKTIVSALCLQRYRRTSPTYWKPVATGMDSGGDTKTIRTLVGPPLSIMEEAYAYAPPVSPHLAAQRAKDSIKLGHLVRLAKMHNQVANDRMVVEGIGGICVPFNQQGDLVIDFIDKLQFPVLIVARSTLGTINHSLLTIQALRSRSIPIVGVVLNGPYQPTNADAITRYGHVRIISNVTPMSPMNHRTVQVRSRGFDRQGLLGRHFGRP